MCVQMFTCFYMLHALHSCTLIFCEYIHVHILCVHLYLDAPCFAEEDNQHSMAGSMHTESSSSQATQPEIGIVPMP